MNNEIEHKIKAKKIFHPVTILLLLCIGTIIISELASLLGIQATYTKVNPITGELQLYIITAKSLFNIAGIQYIISNAIRNFVSFTPFATLLIFLISLGVVEKSGLLKGIINKATNKLNKKSITFLLFFVGILLNVTNEMSYVILIPIGAMLFLLNGRNPLVGVVASFAAVSFGYGINVFITSLDIPLTYYTNIAAGIIDSRYSVGLNSNLFILIAAALLMSWIGTIVTEKITVKRLGKYVVEAPKIDEDLSINHRRGFIYASLVLIFLLLAFSYMLIPGLPWSGILLDNNEVDYLRQLFGSNAYIQDSMPIIISVLFAIVGIFYGLGAGTFKNDKDIIESMNSYIKEIGNIIIIMFFAAQFIAYFRMTNLGIIIVSWCAELIRISNFSGIPVIILTVIIVAIMNLFVTSPTNKWSIISPIIVPTLMQLNITPEFSQMLLRAGDSISNGITPLLAYFYIYIIFINYYNNNKEKTIGMGKAISLTLPYSIAYAILWILILICWYIIGLPIGPGVYPTV
jgi:aminobenzoyl-glutamate transport protein